MIQRFFRVLIPAFTTTKGCKLIAYSLFICGKTGIRTLGTRKGTTVFETVPFDHSGIFPGGFACANLAKFFCMTMF